MGRSNLAGFLVVTCTAGFACQNPVQPLSTSDSPGSVVVALNANTNRWPADAMTLDSARVRNDTLLVFASHGGGCREHEYAAVAWSGWMESNPVQVGVAIAHEANNDLCRALLRPVLRFDLLPLQQAYREAYRNGPAELVIQLSAFAATTRALQVRYSWN